MPILTPFDHKTNKVVLSILHIFERIVVIVLLALMMVILATAVYEMAVEVVTSLAPSPGA